MAVWAELDLSHLSEGDDITAANTDNWFDLKYPTDGYWKAAAVGAMIGIRPRSDGWANGDKDLTGHDSQGRVGWKVEFRSVGGATAYYEMIYLYTGTTIIGDVGLRNAGGTREAAMRTAFTYRGQANGNPMAENERWSFEMEWADDTMTTYVWDSEDVSGAPTYTWTGPLASVPTHLGFGPDGADTVDAVLYDIWVSDGERRNDEPMPGTLVFLSNVTMDGNNVVVVGKTDGAEEVAMTVGGASDTVAPDSAGYFRAVAGPVTAGSSLSAEVLVDGFSARTWTVNTPQNDLDGLSILWGSCFDTYTSQFFTLAANRDPDYIVNLGDRGYQYITGGANGNTSPTDVETVRAHREGMLAAPAVQSLFTAFPEMYTYSDCDGAGANADGTTGGHATGAVQAAYRQQFAHPTLPLADCGARSWVVGRVRFIQTDETALASVRDAPDDATKTKLGATQKAWFKDQIDAAVAAEQSVVWFGDGPWIEPTGVGSETYNSWAKYNTERTEIGNYIAASGVKLVRLHGDTHTLFVDDGTNNSWGGFPTASAAPFHTTAQMFGYTTSGGKWPTETTNSSRQYGVATFSDDGETVTLTVKGYSSTNGAPTEVERFSEVFDITPGGDGPGPDPDPIEDTGQTNSELEMSWLMTQGEGTTLADLRRDVYQPNEHSYFSALSGLETGSLSDHKMAYFKRETGAEGSLADVSRAFWLKELS